MTIHLKTWGDLACFTRPEMKVERVSDAVITRSATRGLLEAILYKPQFRWRVGRIAIKKPVCSLAFRRNEVKARLSPRNPEPLRADNDRTQRNTLALRKVEYVIEASLHLTPLGGLPPRTPANDEDSGEDTPVKYLVMFQRRAEKGQCFAQPPCGWLISLQIPSRDGRSCCSASSSPCRACIGLQPTSQCALPGAQKKPPPSARN